MPSPSRREKVTSFEGEDPERRCRNDLDFFIPGVLQGKLDLPDTAPRERLIEDFKLEPPILDRNFGGADDPHLFPFVWNDRNGCGNLRRVGKVSIASDGYRHHP